jgi:hypothetical protein
MSEQKPLAPASGSVWTPKPSRLKWWVCECCGGRFLARHRRRTCWNRGCEAWAVKTPNRELRHGV